MRRHFFGKNPKESKSKQLAEQLQLEENRRLQEAQAKRREQELRDEEYARKLQEEANRREQEILDEEYARNLQEEARRLQEEEERRKEQERLDEEFARRLQEEENDSTPSPSVQNSSTPSLNSSPSTIPPSMPMPEAMPASRPPLPVKPVAYHSGSSSGRPQSFMSAPSRPHSVASTSAMSGPSPFVTGPSTPSGTQASVRQSLLFAGTPTLAVPGSSSSVNPPPSLPPREKNASTMSVNLLDLSPVVTHIPGPSASANQSWMSGPGPQPVHSNSPHAPMAPLSPVTASSQPSPLQTGPAFFGSSTAPTAVPNLSTGGPFNDMQAFHNTAPSASLAHQASSQAFLNNVTMQTQKNQQHTVPSPEKSNNPFLQMMQTSGNNNQAEQTHSDNPFLQSTAQQYFSAAQTSGAAQAQPTQQGQDLGNHQEQPFTTAIPFYPPSISQQSHLQSASAPAPLDTSKPQGTLPQTQTQTQGVLQNQPKQQGQNIGNQQEFATAIPLYPPSISQQQPHHQSSAAPAPLNASQPHVSPSQTQAQTHPQTQNVLQNQPKQQGQNLGNQQELSFATAIPLYPPNISQQSHLQNSASPAQVNTSQSHGSPSQTQSTLHNQPKQGQTHGNQQEQPYATAIPLYPPSISQSSPHQQHLQSPPSPTPFSQSQFSSSPSPAPNVAQTPQGQNLGNQQEQSFAAAIPLHPPSTSQASQPPPQQQHLQSSAAPVQFSAVQPPYPPPLAHDQSQPQGQDLGHSQEQYGQQPSGQGYPPAQSFYPPAQLQYSQAASHPDHFPPFAYPTQTSPVSQHQQVAAHPSEHEHFYPPAQFIIAQQQRQQQQQQQMFVHNVDTGFYHSQVAHGQPAPSLSTPTDVSSTPAHWPATHAQQQITPSTSEQSTSFHDAERESRQKNSSASSAISGKPGIATHVSPILTRPTQFTPSVPQPSSATCQKPDEPSPQTPQTPQTNLANLTIYPANDHKSDDDDEEDHGIVVWQRKDGSTVQNAGTKTPKPQADQSDGESQSGDEEDGYEDEAVDPFEVDLPKTDTKNPSEAAADEKNSGRESECESERESEWGDSDVEDYREAAKMANNPQPEEEEDSEEEWNVTDADGSTAKRFESNKWQAGEAHGTAPTDSTANVKEPPLKPVDKTEEVDSTYHPFVTVTPMPVPERRPLSHMHSYSTVSLVPPPDGLQPHPLYMHQSAYAASTPFLGSPAPMGTPVPSSSNFAPEDIFRVMTVDELRKYTSEVPSNEFGYYQVDTGADTNVDNKANEPQSSANVNKELPKAPIPKIDPNHRHITVPSVNPGQRVWIRLKPNDTGKSLAERIHIVATYKSRKILSITTSSGRSIPINDKPVFEDWDEIANLKNGDEWSVEWGPMDHSLFGARKMFGQLKAGLLNS